MFNQIKQQTNLQPEHLTKGTRTTNKKPTQPYIFEGDWELVSTYLQKSDQLELRKISGRIWNFLKALAFLWQRMFKLVHWLNKYENKKKPNTLCASPTDWVTGVRLNKQPIVTEKQKKTPKIYFDRFNLNRHYIITPNSQVWTSQEDLKPHWAMQLLLSDNHRAHTAPVCGNTVFVCP